MLIILQQCHLRSTSEDNGAITAQRRTSEEENTGFYFVRCKITGVKRCVLGRPWGPYSRVVFSQTYMSSAVLPQGWDDWGKSSTHRYFIFQYNNKLIMVARLTILYI